MRRSIFALLLLFLSLFSACDDPSYEVYFSPKDHLAKRLVELIDQEQESLYVAIYCLTHRDVIGAIARANERGVDVKVIVDSFSKHKRLAPLIESGVPVYVWKQKSAIMHDKFCIFGKKRVWTGSFNFTYRATRANQENALLIHSSKIAGAYLEAFDGLVFSSFLSPMEL